MLTQTLRSLERDGLVVRKVHPVVPPKVEYSLTRLGRTLIDPLHALCRWSEGHLPELEANRNRANSNSDADGERDSARGMIERVFLLSPAYAGGERARMIMSERAQFDLARRLRSEKPPTLGEVFAFLSGLYFRGKIAYANAFATAAEQSRPFSSSRRLADWSPRPRRSDSADLQEFAEVDIDEADPRYRGPLERDVKRLAKKLSARGEIVLLGSIATGKYVDVLLEHFGERLCFPADFVGRGDMSRGGLLLRCAVDRCELDLHFRRRRGAKRKTSAQARAAKIYEMISHSLSSEWRSSEEPLMRAHLSADALIRKFEIPRSSSG